MQNYVRLLHDKLFSKYLPENCDKKFYTRIFQNTERLLFYARLC